MNWCNSESWLAAYRQTFFAFRALSALPPGWDERFISDIYRGGSVEEFILNEGKKREKKKFFEVSPATKWTAPGTDSIGLQPFQPLILNPFETGTAFILAYCISLYVSADGPFMHTHTGKENIPDNLIHSGSSCNMGAAQQVVLWCLSLVSKISVLISSELSCMTKRTKTKILLSLSPNNH